MATQHTSRTKPALLLACALCFLALIAPRAGAQDDAPDTPPDTPTLTVPAGDPEPEPAPPAPAFQARAWPDQNPVYATLGSTDEASGSPSELAFTRYGAGVHSLKLAGEYVTVRHETHVEVQRSVSHSGVLAVPFALLAAEVNGQRVDLVGFGKPDPVWRELAPGRFEALIETGAGDPAVRITRAFILTPGSYDVAINHTIENLTDEQVTIRLIQTGPISMPEDKSSYGGDKRRFRYGTVTNRQIDLASRGTVDATVSPDTELHGHSWLLGKRNESKRYVNPRIIWPGEIPADEQLVWAALTDRYFTAAVHPIIDPATATSPGDKVFADVARLERLVLNPGAPSAADAIVLLELTSPRRNVPANGSIRADIGFYAGPSTRPVIGASRMLESLGLDHIVVYNFGGICAPCTFSWLTHALLGTLRFNHSWTGDWAIAIILLVIFVRGILHPITRWSQIRMQRFGAQMQAIQPKWKKVQEKYKDDPKKMNEERARLWREEGINPAGMLGCLPMFLQSPVWIALYATLFFAAELRHEPAFYGVFQTMTGGSWQFLSDLASPDSAIPLPSFMHFSFPLWGTVNSINIIPILMGFVFFAHQKYLTPPTATTMTPEQQQQQKIMKIMMVVMFPVFMYAAPSGLAIYFVTNSTIAIFENRWIRAHMNKHDMLDPEKIKAERASKGPGFLQRLQEMAARSEQIRNQARNQGQGFGTGKGRQGMTKRTPAKKVVNRKYKKRD